MTVLLFAGGLALLLVGAEILVRGSSAIAAAAGVSPLIVGLTIVAFGTSSPELAVSVKSALDGQAGIAVGNVVGSNIFNVLFILGVSALLAPLVVSQRLVRLDVPLMIALSVAVLMLSLDGTFGRIDGLLMMACLVAYLAFLFRQSRSEGAEIREEYAREFGSDVRSRAGWMINIVLVVGGLTLLVIGSRLLVGTATAFATALGVSELVVGLTIVAAGTSLPEVVTSIVAAIRGERDIAVGNVVGSNLFNIMGVLGVAAVVAPRGIAITPAVIGFDLPVMIVVAWACLPIFFTGNVISRSEGVLLLAYYVAYTSYLVLAASQHDALPRFSAVMLYFAIPLTVFVLIVVAARETRRQ